MARGGYGLPIVSLWPAMPDTSMPCGRAKPETTLQGGQPLAVFYHLGHPTPYAYGQITSFDVRSFLLVTPCACKLAH
jgi:hypothetical protein